MMIKMISINATMEPPTEPPIIEPKSVVEIRTKQIMSHFSHNYEKIYSCY